MSLWKTSKTKLEAVQAFRGGDQKHDSRYAPEPEPENSPGQAFHPVQPGQGQNAAYYGPWAPHPSMPAQGYYTNPAPQPQYPGHYPPPQAPTQGLGIHQQYGHPPQGHENQQQGYSSPQQPSSPPQGQPPFSPSTANGNAYQNNQSHTFNNNYGPPSALNASPEAGFQWSPPMHSSPEPPQQAHTRPPQRSLTYDTPHEQQFAPLQRNQTEPLQGATPFCGHPGLEILNRCTQCGYRT